MDHANSTEANNNDKELAPTTSATPTPQPSSLKVGSGSGSSLSSNSTVTNFESLVCGGTAGLLSRFIIAPLDVVKIRLQLQFDAKRPLIPASSSTSVHAATSGTAATTIANTLNSPPPILTTTAKILHPKPNNAAAGGGGGSKIFGQVFKIIREEGIRALWKGNVPAEIMYVAYGAVQFTAYRVVSDSVQSVYPKISDPTLSFISGAVSGLSATTLTYPFDLLRTRFAVQGASGSTRIYASLPYAVWHIQKHEGITGFFRGLGPAVVSVVPYMGLMFSSYTQSRELLEYLAPTTSGPGAKFTDMYPFLISHEAIAGFMAGFISKGAVFPFDVLRKRLQVQGPTRSHYMAGTIPLYPHTPMACARYILKHEGIRGFYRGFFVSMLKSAPASAITMWTFENSLHLLREAKDVGYISY